MCPFVYKKIQQSLTIKHELLMTKNFRTQLDVRLPLKCGNEFSSTSSFRMCGNASHR